ncbi:hypothetical protein [Hymenobacter latericus]|uniref:hypothetical protein n=1 Tax=Hymenobacter sp. YIM 151858-1 TaxID=2987688 RepID=UPI002226A382|nr:hypothetical protein [Hymenobacter sp. YIM 151858-1]UYZ60136.1 hypothetical protein OIS50_04870 [Hymenobacter sp. YIM 151858-1]
MPTTTGPAYAQLAKEYVERYPFKSAEQIREIIFREHPEIKNAPRASFNVLQAVRREQFRSAGEPAKAEAAAEEQVNDAMEDGQRVIYVTESNSIRTLDGLLAAAKVNPLEWEVSNWVANKWDVTMKGDNGPEVATNWQVKAWLKPVERLTELTVEEIAKALAPIVKPQGFNFRPKPLAGSENYMLEIDIFDLHLGKVADPLESGESYSLEIACALYKMAVETLLERAKGYPIGTIVLPVGNDFYNSDSILNATTKGTPQHEAGRWQRTFVTGATLVASTVNYLRQRGFKVKVVMVPGNHDFQRLFYLGQVLEATFSGCADVEVDASFSPRKYVQFHDCAIMYTHGSDEKEGNLPMIFAQEQPAMWAATRFREAHLAHIHHKKEFKYRTIHENIGLTVRYMRSLSAVDAWHHQKGYVGSLRSAEAFVWAKGEGVVAHLTFTYTNQSLAA